MLLKYILNEKISMLEQLKTQKLTSIMVEFIGTSRVKIDYGCVKENPTEFQKKKSSAKYTTKHANKDVP